MNVDAQKPVIVADDNPDDIRLLQFAWQNASMSAPLVPLSDGDETLAYLDGVGQFADRLRFPFPRLLLLDLKMPRRNGFEVLQAIRSSPKIGCLPVVVLTASVHKADLVRAYELGANAFLVKPVEIRTLVDMVKAIGLFWLGFNQSPEL